MIDAPGQLLDDHLYTLRKAELRPSTMLVDDEFTASEHGNGCTKFQKEDHFIDPMIPKTNQSRMNSSWDVAHTTLTVMLQMSLLAVLEMLQRRTSRPRVSMDFSKML